MLKKLKETNKKIFITFILLFSANMEGGSYFWVAPHLNIEPNSTILSFTIKGAI